MATKKISELPLVNRVSGSQVAGGSVLPIVIGGGIQGTTNQISVEDFSLFVNAYNATTSSNTFIGTQNVTGDVNISGRLTVKEVVAQYETASILFSTGSTKLGDELTDKHEFTGSTNITGSISVTGNSLLNGVSLNNSFDRLHQATQSLELFTSSQAARNLVLSTVTGSINQATASIQFQTASLLAFTASQDSRNFTLSQVTGSFNYFYQATASIQFQTASLLQFTASQDSRNFTLSQVTGSFNYFYQATASLENFTSSQADRNLVLSIVTGSINQATASLQFHSASVEAQLGRIQQATASLELASASFKYFYQSTASLQTFTASQADRNLVLSIVTGSINQATASLQFQTASLLAFTASQDSRNLTLSTVTGSLIGITNGLMAFTAALDNTYATDAQLYQLYQSTRSLELHSGSMVGVTNGLMAYTASNTSLNTGLRGEVDGIEAYTASLKGQTIFSGSVQIPEIGGLEAYTASLKGQAIVSSSTQVQNYDVFALNSNLYTSTGSLIGITNGLMAFTAALDSTYATDAQLYQLYAETASIKAEIAGIEAYTASLKAASIVSSSTQVQNYDVFALNSNLYNGTGSIKGEIAGIEAYTASLKGAAIVSSSQQIQNYFTFAKTGSANTFYGNQSVSGSLAVNSTGANGISIISSGDSPTLNFTQLAQANGGARNWRLIPNYEGWGTLDIQVSADNATLPSTTTRVSLTAAGDLNIKAGNLVMGTSGKGIDFSATSNGSGTTSSELLNDYEEGTFTPVIVGGSTAGTCTYTGQTASYTKIGNCVYFRVDVIWTGHDGTGALNITGLPFTPASNYNVSPNVRFNSTTLGANKYLGGHLILTTPAISIQLNTIGGAVPSDCPITAAGDLRVAGFYFV